MAAPDIPPFDTQQAAAELRETGGFDQRQADAIVRVGVRATANLATKADLDNGLKSLKSEMLAAMDKQTSDLRGRVPEGHQRPDVAVPHGARGDARAAPLVVPDNPALIPPHALRGDRLRGFAFRLVVVCTYSKRARSRQVRGGGRLAPSYTHGVFLLLAMPVGA